MTASTRCICTLPFYSAPSPPPTLLPPPSAEVEKTEKQLRLFSDTLDEWMECQRQWLYLETIFSAADIQRQLPTEAKAFWQVRGRPWEGWAASG